MKKIVSLVLSLVMVLSLCNVMMIASFAEGEGITATVQGSYEKSELEQDITVRLEVPGVTENYAAFYIDTGIELPEGFVIKSFTTSNSSAQIAEEDYNKNSGTLNYDPVSSKNSIPAGTYYDVVITAPANAVGEYTFTFNDLCAVDSTYNNVLAEVVAIIVTLTIEEPSADYTVGITADKEEINVEDTLNVSINVGGAAGSFATSQIKLTYDPEYLTFDKDSTAHTLNGASVNVNGGEITIVDHGASQNNGVAYQLVFTGKAVTADDTTITLTSAAFDKAENALIQNMKEIELDQATNKVNVSVVEKRFTVELSEDFDTGNGFTVEPGGTFTFFAKNPNYTYTVSVNEGAVAYTYDEDTGVWTIANVQANLVITATKKAKQFSVSIDTVGNFAEAPVTGENAATYKSNYSFTLKADDADYKYNLVSITIGGEPATAGSYGNDGKTYTIYGDYITGDIEITTTATKIAEYNINITQDQNVLQTSKVTVKEGETVELTLTPVAGYKYDVTVNGQTITFVNNKYTASVTQDWNVVVTATLDLSDKNVTIGDEDSETYLTLDGKTVYMIQITTKLNEGNVYTYDGKEMFWSEKYNDNNGAYVYLVVVDSQGQTLTLADVIAKIDVTSGSAKNVDYSGNVNMVDEDTVDANDAQLVYNMYETKEYDGFTLVDMEKYLRADVNGDGVVDTLDAAKIISIILGTN